MAGSRREREDREERVLSARKLVQEYKGDMDRTSMRIPAGVSTFKIEKEGTYEIDIIPYICGKGNPNCDPGEPHYERIYYQHFKVGVDGHSYICLSTFGEKCPVCEEYAHANLNPRLTEDEKKAVKQLKKKERQVLNIIDVKDPKKGIQIWDTSTFWFWQNLQARLKRAGEDSPYNLFADPVKGYTLIIGAVEKESGGFSFINCVIDGFERREKPYTWKIADEAPCLDDLLVETDYEDLYNILKGEPRRDREKDKEESRGRKSFSVGGRKDEEEDRPARRGRDEEEDAPRRSRREEPEPEETEVTAKEMEIEVESVVEHEDLGVCTVTKVARDGKTITVEDDRKKTHKDVPVGEFKLWDGEEDDPKEKDDEPAPRRGRREEPEDDPAPRGRRAAKEDEPEDDAPRRSRRREEPEEEAEDDAPRGRRSRREEPEEEADDAPRSRRGRKEEPEDEPAPRGRRAAKEEPEDEPLEDTDAKDEPDDEPAPRRGRGRR